MAMLLTCMYQLRFLSGLFPALSRPSLLVMTLGLIAPGRS